MTNINLLEHNGKTINRIYSLDFLRIIATLIIVMHHYQQLMRVFFDGPVNFYGDEFYFGYLVEFFFILSGYLCVIREKNLKDYMTHRCARLLPLLAISVIVYEVLIYLYGLLNGTDWKFGTEINIWGSIITALGLQSGGAFANPMINSPTWYISVLLLCYLLYYLVTSYAVSHNFNVNIVYGIVIICSISALTFEVNLPFMNYESARGYLSFFVGILLHKIINKYHDNGYKKYVVSSILVIWLTWCMINHLEWMSNGLNYILIFIYYPCIILLFTSNFIEKILNFKWLGTLGKISYDVYIWHCPFFLLLYIFVELGLKLNFSRYRYMLLYTCMACIVGAISYFIIDKPITKKIHNKIN